MTIGYHEENLSAEVRDLHRAIASAIEELEAVDWYSQRMDVAADDDLREALRHNRDEEIEHFAMMVEWLRRRMPEFDRELRAWLFKEGPIGHDAPETAPAIPAAEDSSKPASTPNPSGLGIGRIQ